MAKLSNGALSAQLDRATRKNGQFCRATCIRFAKANSVWKDSYSALDNGRVAMNCRNAIRSKVKAGDKIVWVSK